MHCATRTRWTRSFCPAESSRTSFCWKISNRCLRVMQFACGPIMRCLRMMEESVWDRRRWRRLRLLYFLRAVILSLRRTWREAATKFGTWRWQGTAFRGCREKSGRALFWAGRVLRRVQSCARRSVGQAQSWEGHGFSRADKRALALQRLRSAACPPEGANAESGIRGTRQILTMTPERVLTHA